MGVVYLLLTLFQLIMDGLYLTELPLVLLRKGVVFMCMLSTMQMVIAGVVLFIAHGRTRDCVKFAYSTVLLSWMCSFISCCFIVPCRLSDEIARSASQQY